VLIGTENDPRIRPCIKLDDPKFKDRSGAGAALNKAL